MDYTMSEAAIHPSIKEELHAIRKDLDYIKNHMVDADAILGEDDYRALQEYRHDKAKGNLTPHEKLKKDLGL